ncbi:unnamed protein product [Adineta steineri]|uniref:Major facilitator superfamily associated domain-containing protein n=1 Tax=Adineta steineri TaxID=433720 RepID=A0A819RGK1_9BILA|nr:unnamed protein product [Adineta steineri]
MFVASSILTVIITSFVRIRSDKHNAEKSNQDDLSVIEELNETSVNENEEKPKTKNSPFKICAILPLLKNFDVMVFLATTFLWGTSYGGMDPYLLLYIDEISPCVSHSIVGYMSLITSTVEVIALFVAHKLIKCLGTKISSILIFIAFIIRFTGYYFIRRPYLLLPLETMHFFNFGILYVLIAQQALEIAPPGLSGTLQGIVYGTSFGLGRGVGLLISLFIYTRMKKRYLFLIYALFNLVGVIIYSIYCLLSKRRSSSSFNTNGNHIFKLVPHKLEDNEKHPDTIKT